MLPLKHAELVIDFNLKLGAHVKSNFMLQESFTGKPYYTELWKHWKIIVGQIYSLQRLLTIADALTLWHQHTTVITFKVSHVFETLKPLTNLDSWN